MTAFYYIKHLPSGLFYHPTNDMVDRGNTLNNLQMSKKYQNDPTPHNATRKAIHKGKDLKARPEDWEVIKSFEYTEEELAAKSITISEGYYL